VLFLASVPKPEEAAGSPCVLRAPTLERCERSARAGVGAQRPGFGTMIGHGGVAGEDTDCAALSGAAVAGCP